MVDSRDLAELRAPHALEIRPVSPCWMGRRFDWPWIVDLFDYLFTTHDDQFGGLLSVLYSGGIPVAEHFGLRSDHVLAQ